uniref:uncharacterized protein LOC120346798 isoform X4 n=1 Tax=Styela clava TaxID=7725 RepID=UPI0019394728|nr:uncharacterized protein LOC120346798 isoform X4 [Styela clava]
MTLKLLSASIIVTICLTINGAEVLAGKLEFWELSATEEGQEFEAEVGGLPSLPILPGAAAWANALSGTDDFDYLSQIAKIQYGSPLDVALQNLRTEGMKLTQVDLVELISPTSAVNDMITQKQKMVEYSTALRNFNCVHFPCKYDGNCELIPLIDFSDELKESLKIQTMNEISIIMGQAEFFNFYKEFGSTDLGTPEGIETVVHAYLWDTSDTINPMLLNMLAYTVSPWISDDWMPELEINWNTNAWKLINFIELFIAQKIIAMSLSDLARYESIETVAAMYQLVGKAIRCSCALGFGGTHCEFCVLTDASLIADNEFEYHGIKPISAEVG